MGRFVINVIMAESRQRTQHTRRGRQENIKIIVFNSIYKKKIRVQGERRRMMLFTAVLAKTQEEGRMEKMYLIFKESGSQPEKKKKTRGTKNAKNVNYEVRTRLQLIFCRCVDISLETFYLLLLHDI